MVQVLLLIREVGNSYQHYETPGEAHLLEQVGRRPGSGPTPHTL